MKKKNISLKLFLITLAGMGVIFLLGACDKEKDSMKSTGENTGINRSVESEKSEEVKIIIQESPPFSYTKNGEYTGFVTEIVKEIMKEQELTTPFTILPFKRGYELTSEEPMTMLAGMTRTLERENLFKWVGPVAEVKMGFYALKDSGLSLSSLKDLKDIESIGVTLGYYTDQYLTNEGFENVSRADKPEDMLELLLKGRTPIILSDNIAMNELMKSQHIPFDDIKMVYEVSSKKSYLAFSLGTPDDLVKNWNDAFDIIYGNGKMMSIYEIWLPNEKLPEKK